MAYSVIAFVAPNYRDYKNEWLKAYEPGTPTPKAMALDSGGVTQVAKLQLNADGFLVSAGDALVIPYIDGNYDLWLFPTEAEADANDTSNAIRLADDINSLNTSLINDLSQAYEFSAVDAMTSSLIVFPTGKQLTTNVHNTTSNKGGATYTVTAGSSPNIGSPALTVGLYASLNQGNIVNVMQWGALGDGTPTDHVQIQAAEDFARPLRRKVFFPTPSVTYGTALPLVADTYSNWEGEGLFVSITKLGNTTSGLPNVAAPERAFDDVMDVDAVVVVNHAANAFTVFHEFKNIFVAGDNANATKVAHGIYMPRANNFKFDNVYYSNVGNCLFGYVVFAGSFSGMTGFSSDTFINMANDGGGNGGTSLNFERCFSNGCDSGFDIWGLSYSSFTACGSDAASVVAYDFESCKGISINGSGMEGVDVTAAQAILINGSNVIINGFSDFDVEPNQAKIRVISGSTLTLNNVQLTDYADPAGRSNIIIQDGSKVIMNNSSMPSNGIAPSLAGGSSLVEIKDGDVTLKTSTNSTTITAATGLLIPAYKGTKISVAAGSNVDTLLGRLATNVDVNLTSPTSDTSPTLRAECTESNSAGVLKIRYFNLITGAQDFGTYDVDIVAY